MSNSQKISILDLQAPDLSQYGKKNLEINPGSSRSADSSYRRQLSESLSKKQSDSTVDRKQGPESRSIDFQSDQKKSSKTDSHSRSSADYREGQVQQRESRRDSNVEAYQESKSTSESTQTAQESQSKENSKSVESIEENDLNTLQEVKLPENEAKGQVYSLFESTFATQTEDQLAQEVTIGDGELQPPANFQFAEDQTDLSLQTEVTETGSLEPLPIPEGLADLLQKQVVDTSQTEINQQLQTDETNELNSASQKVDTLQALTEDDEAVAEANALLNSEEFLGIQITEELKAAIEEFEAQHSDHSPGSTEESEVNIQAVLQQRYLRSKNQEQSESAAEESGQGELTLDNESIQTISETVIEQVQPEVNSEQTDITKIVNEKTPHDSEGGEQQTEEVATVQGSQNLNPGLEIQSRAQTDATKVGSISQEPATTNENNQPVPQQIGLNQTATVTGNQAAASVGPTVDANQVEQLVERISSSIRQSQSTGQQLKIRLSPPELGTLQIEVSLKNGEYLAKLEVQNNHAQKVINDNIAQLKEALAKTGVSIDRIDVHINTDASEDQRSSNSDAQSQTGNDFDANQFSENSEESDQWQEEQAQTDESVTREDAEIVEQNSPQVVRSQGVESESVEEIDVQI
ncbi:flagellar hook-length control protein FliK [Gimesia aquarii]|uniref:Flagellar hook-length control protein FliK n=1 Tax=Gimesia aquarii TaxID=2527964 RepID=A0A517WWB7_9PLAN|nr:flagellar hook-length control protein FliK [Gimesia aquarii]QDU09519.1 Flagellar hook-length control protein FliK [Gimesia aquarii]